MICDVLHSIEYLSLTYSICTNMDVVSLVAEVEMNIINVKRVCQMQN